MDIDDAGSPVRLVRPDGHIGAIADRNPVQALAAYGALLA